MRGFLLIIYSLSAVLTGCQTESIEPPKKFIKDGVIVWQKPLWRVPHDTAYYVSTSMKPYIQYDNKVIVETYKNGRAGIRSMEVETGNVVWEKYFGPIVPAGGFGYFINKPYVNEAGRFIILSIGSWGNKMHTRLNLDTGATEWETSLETYASMEGMGDHYYCTVATSDEVAPIYRVDAISGVAEHYYTSTLETHPDCYAQRYATARPFMQNGKEYLVLDEMRWVDPSTSHKEYFFSLMEAETKELLIKLRPIDSPVSKVELVNGELYMFTGNGYKILNLATHSITREVKLINRGGYSYHAFYKDKLIVGLWGGAIHPEPTIFNYHFVLNLKTHEKLFQIEANPYPSSILRDIIYIAGSGMAYRLNDGKCAMNLNLSNEPSLSNATYTNGQGKSFFIIGDDKYTYCFEAI